MRRQLIGRRLAEPGQRRHRLGLDLAEPRVRVVGDAGAGDHLERRPALLGGVVPGGRGVDDRDQVERLDEHRPAHPEHAHDRALVVQRSPDGCRVGPRVARGHARDDGQVDRRRVRAVQPDQVAGGLGHARRAGVRCQMVATGQPRPALVAVDPPHDFTVATTTPVRQGEGV